MRYQELAVNYAKALMLGVTAPTESKANECAAMASQIGASLRAETKAEIQKSIEVQVKLLTFLEERGVK
jgi:hypothetical protein